VLLTASGASALFIAGAARFADARKLFDQVLAWGVSMALAVPCLLRAVRLGVRPRWARAALLYGIEATDVWVFLGAALILAIGGAVVAWLPARHAARIDPAIMLRYE
jgi:ABC-type lipoprotein release transport system permease subunit